MNRRRAIPMKRLSRTGWVRAAAWRWSLLALMLVVATIGFWLGMSGVLGPPVWR